MPRMTHFSQGPLPAHLNQATSLSCWDNQISPLTVSPSALHVPFPTCQLKCKSNHASLLPRMKAELLTMAMKP